IGEDTVCLPYHLHLVPDTIENDGIYDWKIGTRVYPTGVTTIDSILSNPGVYTFSLLALNDCSFNSSQTIHEINVQDCSLGAVSQTQLISKFEVNSTPASESFEIKYSLVHPAAVSIEIYDLLGQKVKTLFNKQSGDTNLQTLSVNTATF